MRTSVSPWFVAEDAAELKLRTAAEERWLQEAKSRAAPTAGGGTRGSGVSGSGSRWLQEAKSRAVAAGAGAAGAGAAGWGAAASEDSGRGSPGRLRGSEHQH